MKDKLYIEELEATIYDIFYRKTYDDIMNFMKYSGLSESRKKEICKFILVVEDNYKNKGL